ncbi:MAG: hypothetical protein ABIE47_14540 [Pseudomonadota bacterium]
MKFECDPSTIFRSYGARAEIGQKGAFFKGLMDINGLEGNYGLHGLQLALAWVL